MVGHLRNITTDANETVAKIHDRLPLILAPVDCMRWLNDEPDPRLDAAFSRRADAQVAVINTG